MAPHRPQWILASAINPQVDAQSTPRFNPRADDTKTPQIDHGAMTTTDYLINGLFLLVIVRQARERELDLRSMLVPFGLLAFVAHLYIHTIPTAGNDLVFVTLLAAVGLTLGLISGFATHIRAGDHGVAVARVGWVAGLLLAFGITARMAFAFAVAHGAQHTVASFSLANHITAAAWPVALVAMAICEVTARIVVVQVRGHQVMAAGASRPQAVGAAA